MSISIKHGVNTLNLDGLSGQTVGQIRERVTDVLTMGSNEEARLNGNPVSDDTTVSDGQTLEFVKVAGEKGARAAA